jgi:predicted nucleic acid-binding protein
LSDQIFHVDTDVLVHAISHRGPEQRRILKLADSDVLLEASSIVWYEFSRGPRTPEQLAVARHVFGEDGIIPFSEQLAEAAGEQFRLLGSPRKRASDIAIGVVARSRGAVLLTRNARDFAGIDGLRLEDVK